MSTAHSIRHKIRYGKWVRPQIGYDAWKKINDYARSHEMDFPSAANEAAKLLIGN